MINKPRREPEFTRRKILKTIGVAGVATTIGSSGVAAQSNTNEIEDWNDFNALREDLDGEYVLVADLDKNTVGYDEHVANPDGGFESIGSRGTPFTGTFDGQDNEIQDVVIDRPDEDGVGLFGLTSTDAVIIDTILLDFEINGGSEVGGLIGSNDGEVTKVFVNGTITATGSTAGGLIGTNYGSITESVASGAVEGGNNAGGLVGSNAGEIADSAASGEVSGKIRVGGLVGAQSKETVRDIEGEIQESFAIAEVSGDRDVGGLVGHGNTFGQVTASYWDTTVSGHQDGVGDGSDEAVTGLTTAQMQGEAAGENMSALNFKQTWQVATDPVDYPVLRSQSSERFAKFFAQDTPAGSSGNSVPGFGIGSGTVAVGVCGYILKRRVTDH